MPAHKLTCRTKRVGGGFGGKETRFIPCTAGAAVAARQLNRPVRLALDRHEDMQITGHRHAFVSKYKVARAPGMHAVQLQLVCGLGENCVRSVCDVKKGRFLTVHGWALLRGPLSLFMIMSGLCLHEVLMRPASSEL